MKTKNLCSFILVVVLMSCGTSQSSFRDSDILREATGTPEVFEPAPGAEYEGTSCISPLIDPGDGSRITFIRSTSGKADYEVPRGKYGVEKGELLRVDCRTGKSLGIVKR